MYRNVWEKAQLEAKTKEQYILAGIGWTLDDTGELPDVDEMLEYYGVDGLDEMYVSRFTPITRTDLEKMLTKSLLKMLKVLDITRNV
jgi:hypothetical protein